MQRLRWSSPEVPQPVVTGTVAGPLNFQLTVTQGDGQQSTCAVHDGAVTTDDNGTVAVDTGNAALDDAVATLIGREVQLGRNPWIYYDQAAVWSAAAQIADMDVHYANYWDTPAPGTVSVATGSNAITGVGTNFLSTVCNSDGTPKNNANVIIVWYLTGRVFNGVPETGRRRLWVGACQSDTHLTLTTQCCGPGTWQSDTPDGSGLQYSLQPAGALWDFSAAPANYYDNVHAYYALYFRSGIDTYLAAARKLADRFWTSPEIDRGMAFAVGVAFGQQQGRSNEVSGLVLRALDTGDGHPDMWPGLRLIWVNTRNYLVNSYPAWSNSPGAGIDPRETGYVLAQATYGAMWDPDPQWQAYCRGAIESAFQAGPAGIFPKTLDPGQHAWLQFYGMKSGFDGGKPWSGSRVVLTPGSRTVACAGNNCGWQAADFARYSVNGGNCADGSPTCGYVPVLFTDATDFPADSSHTDAASYCYPNGCTFVDENHFTLDRPYEGRPGTHGWAFGVANGTLDPNNTGVVGWGNLPYMEGILGWAFSLAGRAMACDSPGTPSNCDDATSALAYAYNARAASWIVGYGRLPTYGLSYFAGYPVCGTPAAATNTWCTRGMDAISAREIMGDAIRGLMAAYQHSPSASLKATIDTWYAGMWGKPGTNPAIPSPDGLYDVNFDGSGCDGCGQYLKAGGPYAQKFFGQHFGISNQASWPALRSGSLQPGRPISIYVKEKK